VRETWRRGGEHWPHRFLAGPRQVCDVVGLTFGTGREGLGKLPGLEGESTPILWRSLNGRIGAMARPHVRDLAGENVIGLLARGVRTGPDVQIVGRGQRTRFDHDGGFPAALRAMDSAEDGRHAAHLVSVEACVLGGVSRTAQTGWDRQSSVHKCTDATRRVRLASIT
jgi:hypothetical protein